MAELYLYILIFVSGLIFLWGLQKTERIYQFPFVINAIFLAFIIPQCLSIYLSPGVSVTQNMIERYFLMASLCLFMSWLGYQIPVTSILDTSGQAKYGQLSLSYKRLVFIGILFVIIAYVASFILTLVPTARLMTGPATICIFFRRWIFYGFAILLLCTINNRRTKLDTAKIFLLAALFLILTIILNARREPTMTFLLLTGTIVYFNKRIVVPRLVPILVIVSILFINPIIGNIRGISSAGNWIKLIELNPMESAYNYYIKYHDTNQADLLEVRNGALLMDATVQDLKYGFGTGYWDALIKYYVPGQIIGKERKESFKFNLTDKLIVRKKYNYHYYLGQTFTGIADSFVEFDFSGCIFFFILAYFYKRLWYIATYRNSLIAQISYSIIITSSMLVVTHGTQRFIRDIVILWILIAFINKYCHVKKTVHTR